MLARFYPKGLPQEAPASAVPFSPKFLSRVIEALDCEPGEIKHPELVTPYQQRIGSLMYCCTATRCDIAFSVHYLCRCMTRPTPDLMLELDYIFAYLSRHRGVGLTFSSGTSTLHMFSDSSWETRNSTSGWVAVWQGCALLWGSSKQKCTALSSCEAELIALSESTKDAVYLRKFISGLDATHIDGPTELATDNEAARHLSYNPEQHNKTKHIQRRHFFVRDMVEAFEIRVPRVATKDNWADFFTKPLASKEFMALRALIMNEGAATARRPAP